MIKPGQKRSTTQILTRSDPKIRGQEPKTLSKRAHNPLLKEAGLTKPTAAHPSGARWLGGRLVRLACPWRPEGESGHRTRMHASSAEKLGVIEASYASAIIGVLSPVSSLLSPVSSHCPKRINSTSSASATTTRNFSMN